MSSEIKATPTEYRGVRYRSKSEAMFARWIDTNGCFLAIGHGGVVCASGFEYEPRSLTVDNPANQNERWCIDFLVWNVVNNFNDIASQIPLMHYSLIEYKPSKPTESYLGTLGEKMDRIRICNPFLFSANYYCFYGSVFNQSRNVIQYSKGNWVFSNIDWLDGSESDLLSYRFDLENRHA